MLSIPFDAIQFESNGILYSPSRKSSNSIGTSLYLTGRGSPNLPLHLLARRQSAPIIHIVK